MSNVNDKMHKTKKQPRVFLGKPYNKIYYWNTAVKILNSNHRGEYDTRFSRKNKPPHHATELGTADLIGGTGTSQVRISKVSLDDMITQTRKTGARK